jgi:hypothetical protein
MTALDADAVRHELLSFAACGAEFAGWLYRTRTTWSKLGSGTTAQPSGPKKPATC